MAATLGYYCLLYFCSSNIALFVMTGAYVLLLTYITKSLSRSLLAAFIAVTPVAKMRSVEIPVIPKSLVKLDSANDLVYYIGISIQDALLAGLLYAAYRRRIVDGVKPVTYPRPILFLFLFFLTSVVAIFTSPVPDVSLYASVLVLRAVAVYALASLLDFRWNDIGMIVSVLYAAVLFQVGWGGMQMVTGSRLGRFIEATSTQYAFGKTAWENRDLFRISGTFIDPDLYGTFLLMGSVFVGILALRKQLVPWMQEWAPWIVLATLPPVIYTANRGLYLLAAAAVAAVSVLYAHTGVFQRFRANALAIRIAAAGFILLALPYATERMLNIGDFFSTMGSGTFRLQMLLVTSQLGIDHLLGVGLMASPYYFATGFAGERLIFSVDYPHNLISQIFAETGIAGLLLFLAFLYMVFKPYLLNLRRHPGAPMYAAALVYVMSAQFYPLFLDNPELFTLFILLVGIAPVLTASGNE